MKRSLILMRHARAEIERYDMKDRERAITIEGMHELDSIRLQAGPFLSEIDLILCSNAKRARQTLEGIRPSLPTKVNITFDDQLYNSNLAMLWNKIHSLNNNTNTVLLIAHNPGLTELVQDISHQSIDFSILPTCGIAVYEGQVESWRNVGPSNMVLNTFIKA